MRIQLNKLNETTCFDIAIFGAGFAGLTLATELSKFNKKIILIETGGEISNTNSQNEYKGKVIGDPYLNLDECRNRSFGGTSNLWAGWCRNLDSHDFYDKGSNRTGWPINKADLDPFLHRACKILNLNYEDLKKIKEQNNKKISDDLKEINFIFSNVKRDNALHKKYFRTILNSNINLLLNTNIKKININSKRVINFEVFSDNVIANIYSKNYVLCCGGIENNRILLWQNYLNNNCLIKNNKFLGKHLTEHPHFLTGLVSIYKKSFIKKINNTDRKMLFYSPTKKVFDKYKILNFSLRLRKTRPFLLTKIMGKIFENMNIEHIMSRKLNELGIYLSDVGAVYEQQPNINNRISLDSKNKDSYGVPLVNFYFKKNEIDYKTPKIATLLLKDYFEKSKIGKIELLKWMYTKKKEPTIKSQGYYYVGHHIGGTRMSSSPENGICDKNLKVHNLENLFILGSSSMPSCGHANPTLTIIQLSIRLSKHFTKI